MFKLNLSYLQIESQLLVLFYRKRAREVDRDGLASPTRNLVSGSAREDERKNKICIILYFTKRDKAEGN
jgi:hypothetical protein